MAVRKLVIIVQHGEKEPIPGDPGLTATGRRQANCAGRWISERFSVEGLWTSPLRRAAETASEVARWTGSAVRTDERLRERTNWTGPGNQPLEDFLAEWRRCWIDSSYVPTGGDSSSMAAERFLAALDDLRGTGTVTVAVAHGGVTVDALRALLGDEVLLATHPGLIIDGVPAGSITQLAWSGRVWEPKVIAATRHLETVTPHGPG